MALTGSPPNASQIGSIEIGLFLSDDGISTAYGFEGMTKEAAIGYLVVVGDRMREERGLEWDTCPGCGEPWENHGNSDEEDEDGV